jgi:hypothetical protein
MKACVLTIGLLLVTGIPFTAASNQALPNKPERKIISISLAETKEMLSSKLTREEVEKKLGPPAVGPKGNWGNFWYNLPQNKYLLFWFKGPYIYEANYDGVELKGAGPKTYKMYFDFDYKKQTFSICLDNERFEDVNSFKNYLSKLPKNSIIEWQHSDIIFTSIKEPIRTEEEVKSFEKYCNEAGIILIQYLGG